MKKKDDVSVNDDDDALRISVSQNQVTVTLCTKGLFLRTQCIYLSQHFRQVKLGGGAEMYN